MLLAVSGLQDSSAAEQLAQRMRELVGKEGHAADINASDAFVTAKLHGGDAGAPCKLAGNASSFARDHVATFRADCALQDTMFQRARCLRAHFTARLSSHPASVARLLGSTCRLTHSLPQLSIDACAGDLTINDFIIATKLNQQDFSDLLKKRKARFWA